MFGCGVRSHVLRIINNSLHLGDVSCLSTCGRGVPPSLYICIIIIMIMYMYYYIRTDTLHTSLAGSTAYTVVFVEHFPPIGGNSLKHTHIQGFGDDDGKRLIFALKGNNAWLLCSKHIINIALQTKHNNVHTDRHAYIH